MKISIHQPLFCPYRGHFRLLEQSEIHVVLDCVQFPRRHFVHRNRLRTRQGDLDWLTVPLEYAPQETPIEAIHIASDGKARMALQMRRFPALDRLPLAVNGALRDCRGALVSYNMRVMEACCWELGIPFKVVYSSGMALGDLKGQARIIEICKRLGATHYLNAPGGTGLYDALAFRKENIQLEFLGPWEGRMESVLEMLSERAAA